MFKSEEAIARSKADETEAIANDAQKNLDEASPALESANKVRTYSFIHPYISSPLSPLFFYIMSIYLSCPSVPSYLFLPSFPFLSLLSFSGS